MSELISRCEVHRRTVAQIFYDFEAECRRRGWGDFAFVYDEEKDLFRWTGGRFAFSHEHADWALSRKRGRMRGRIAVDSHRYLALTLGDNYARERTEELSKPGYYGPRVSEAGKE